MQEVKVVKCPFDPAHVLTSDRLQRHIMKCMQKYPNHFTCPFFAQHKFLEKAAYEAHIKSCPEKWQCYTTPIQQVPQPSKVVPVMPPPGADECMDGSDW